MSVTGHRDVRQADDNYATPEWAVRLLLPHLQRGDVLEPCCGEGAIGKVISETWRSFAVDGCEIDEERCAAAYASQHFAAVWNEDFLDKRADDDFDDYPLIITNPPFSLAMPFLEKSLRVADTVAFLLRLAWLSSAERNAFHREHPSDLIVLPKRPSFAKFASCNGSKTVARCAWEQVYKPSEEHPKQCPGCGQKVKVSTSDSADYGWMIWGPGRGGRIIHPPVEAIDVAAENKKFDGAASELEALTR